MSRRQRTKQPTTFGMVGSKLLLGFGSLAAGALVVAILAGFGISHDWDLLVVTGGGGKSVRAPFLFYLVLSVPFIAAFLGFAVFIIWEAMKDIRTAWKER